MNAFGLFIADTFTQEHISELVERRNVAAVPFGGRYRLVDFMLSNAVNASVDDIGVLVGEKHNALVDHLANGKDWGLNRKNGGLKILTPYLNSRKANYQTVFDLLNESLDYMHHVRSRYCILAPVNIIANIDFKEMLNKHVQTGADITVLVIRDNPHNKHTPINEVTVEDDGHIKEVLYHKHPLNAVCYQAAPVYIMDKELIEHFIERSKETSFQDSDYPFIKSITKMYSVYAYPYEGFYRQIHSIQDYYEANMALLDQRVSRQVFQAERKIFTRIKDSVPTLYGTTAQINNSLVADGCEIEGQVENSIIFRDVKIKKNVVVKNSIIMQGAIVDEQTVLNYVVADKNTRIQSGQQIGGSSHLPYVIRKGMVI